MGVGAADIVVEAGNGEGAVNETRIKYRVCLSFNLFAGPALAPATEASTRNNPSLGSTTLLRGDDASVPSLATGSRVVCGNDGGAIAVTAGAAVADVAPPPNVEADDDGDVVATAAAIPKRQCVTPFTVVTMMSRGGGPNGAGWATPLAADEHKANESPSRFDATGGSRHASQ